MKIALVFERVYEHTMGTYFERALRALGLEVTHFQAHDADKVPQGYDCYLRIDDSYLDYVLPRSLQPQVLFVSDLHLPHVLRKVLRQIKQYRLVLTPVRKEIARLESFGIPVVWFNVGCEPEFHYPMKIDKCYDIGFVGNDGGDPRKFIIEALYECYPNSFFGHVDYRNLSEIYSASKIGFNYAIRGEYFQMRSYEIMASGTMLLMQELPDDSIRRLGFENGKHLVLFRTMKEMFAAVDYYLNQDEEREKIALNGYSEVLAHHTYRHRMFHLIELLRKHLGLSIELSPLEGYVLYSL